MYNRMAVYAVAHQDDWQLFMDPHISADINDAGCKTIIIHTTAGDAGEDRKYWRAREYGAINSLKFRICHDVNRPVTSRYISVGKKKIFKAQIGDCQVYFLRLPDGGMYGEGFDRYACQSISKLRLQAIDELKTVDGKNTFHSFSEITRLLDQILSKEMGLLQHASVSLNFPEYNHAINPNDHNDHLNTALLVGEMNLYASARKRAFVHYHIEHAANDLVGTDLFWKVGMFSIYHQTVMDLYGHSTIGETPQYSVWSRKNVVYRDIPNGLSPALSYKSLE